MQYYNEKLQAFKILLRNFVENRKNNHKYANNFMFLLKKIAISKKKSAFCDMSDINFEENVVEKNKKNLEKPKFNYIPSEENMEKIIEGIINSNNNS